MPVRVFEFEGLITRNNSLASRFDLVNDCSQFDQPTRQRAQELLFFAGYGFEDEITPTLELGVGIAHQIDHTVYHVGEKGLFEANGPPLIDGTAQNTA
jgi:hypothetical protein